MNRFFAAFAAAVLVTATAAGCTEDDPGDGGIAATAAAPCDRALDASFSAWASAGFSGSVAISTGGRFECRAAYGSANDAANTPNTTGTVFSIGSITKAFTAAAVHHLVDDGKLSLDDRAGGLLPELKGPVAGATVRQLLLHTSGLKGSHGNDTEPLSRDAAVKAIGELELVSEPGSAFLYSNAGYTLLALIIDKLSGSSYRDYVVSNILPLGGGRVAGGFWNGEPAAPQPRALGYFEDGATGEHGDFAGPYWAVEGNGGLAMTTGDLAMWTHALFTGRVVSPASTKSIATPGHRVDDGRSETPGWVAYDASVFGEPFLATAGGGGDVGHNAVVMWLPAERRAIAMASNKPRISAEALLKKIGPALAAGRALPTPDTSAVKADLAAAAGRYVLATGGSFEVVARKDRLAVAATGADAVAALFPPPADVTADDLRAHEAAVSALLAGQTQEGRKERRFFEDDFGPIANVALAGTIAAGGAIRTYVNVTTGKRVILGWFELNEAGGVEGAEIPTGAPTLDFLPSGDDRYHPDDPTGAGPDTTVAFTDGRMTVTGRTGSTVAPRAD
jgi:CubicO group peptidase (beta-lactamase class C family)